MAFPRLNALSFWHAADAGVSSSPAWHTRRRTVGGMDGVRALSVHQPLGQIFFNMGVQWGRRELDQTALTLVTIITARAGMTFWRMRCSSGRNFNDVAVL